MTRDMSLYRAAMNLDDLHDRYDPPWCICSCDCTRPVDAEATTCDECIAGEHFLEPDACCEPGHRSGCNGREHRWLAEAQ